MNFEEKKLICSTIAIVAAVVFLTGWNCAIKYYVIDVQHRDSQLKQDHEVLTYIRTWCEQKTANVRESHVKELVRLRAECEANTLSLSTYFSQHMEDRSNESEKRISELEDDLQKRKERTKDTHVEYQQIISKLVDDNKEELERERSLFDKEINRREDHTIMNCQTDCEKELERERSMFNIEINKREVLTWDCHTECQQRVSNLVDDNENELIKQRNECELKMNYLDRELRKTIDVVKKELEMCKVADSEKSIGDHAFNLYQSIVCYHTLLPNTLCRRSRQQNVLYET